MCAIPLLHEFTLFGATPRRLARQFLTEALILALAGGGLGLLLAEGALRVLVLNAPVGIPRVDGIHIDLRVVLFAIGVAGLAGAVCGLLPVMRLARGQPADALRSAGPTVSAGKPAARLRGALVVGEIALCAALLPGAVLLIASLRHVLRANLWTNQDHVTTALWPFRRFLRRWPSSPASFRRGARRAWTLRSRCATSESFSAVTLRRALALPTTRHLT